MSLFIYRLATLALVVGGCLGAEAQGSEQADAPVTPIPSHLEQVPKVPGVSTLLHGINVGVTFSGVHNSSIGWYTAVTPAASFTFSPHYSADASASIYPTRMVENQNPAAAASEPLVLDAGDAGDTFIGMHARFAPRLARTMTTAALTIPSGDRSVGLGAGKVTFDLSEHLERYFRQTGFIFDLGAGDSSGLFNRLVTNDYTSVGPLAHFQEGVVFWLFGRDYIQSLAYEQLPIGNQTVYTSPGPPGSTGVSVVSGSGLGHDAGVTTSLGIPLTANLTLSGYYNRSFEQNLDTVSTGITYVLRGRAEYKRLSMIDKALREAEGDSQQPHR